MSSFSKSTVPNCFSCNFKQTCFFRHLEPAAQKVWNDTRLSCQFSNEDKIYCETEKPTGIYIVCRGRAKIYTIDAKGQQLINWIRHPGEIFGHIALLSNSEYFCNSTCMGDTTISYISSTNLTNFLNTYPKAYQPFINTIATEIRNLQLRLKDTAYKPAKAKVALALINAISFKSKNTSTPTIYGLKRTEIAEITGLALETVVRTLAELEKKKIIKREAKAIKIVDLPTLVKTSGTQP